MLLETPPTETTVREAFAARGHPPHAFRNPADGNRICWVSVPH